MVGDDMKLTQEEKRIKLAEAAGWKPDKRGLGWLSPHGYYAPPPDYFNDLNAVHELEQQIWSKEWNLRDDFCDHLALIIDPVHGYRGLKAIDALQATAAQRAESLGLALNLW
jgi:hypothetical protein